MTSRHGHGHMLREYRLGDVVFRLGVALTFTWIYLRTLLVTTPGVDPETWTAFAWTGWPLLLLVWWGAVATLVAWRREQ